MQYTFALSGTLTDGKLRVKGTDPVRLSEEQLVYLASYAEAWSEHPLAMAVRLYAGALPDRTRVERHRKQHPVVHLFRKYFAQELKFFCVHIFLRFCTALSLCA